MSILKVSFLFIFLATISCNSPIQKEKIAENLYTYNVEEKIKELGITLTEQKMPKGLKIEFAVQSGNLVYLSGNGPILSNGEKIQGKVGTNLTIEEGYEAARQTGINLLSVLKSHIGDLNKVEKIVKVLGMVNAESDFEDHPKVINGFSDLMVEVFGERGKHARSAVGMSSLPWNLACEIEMIVQIKE